MKLEFSTKGMLSMQHLSYKRVWLGMGALMLSAVVLASVTSMPQAFRTIMMQDKLVHTLAYASLMMVFAQIFRHDLTRLLLVVGLSVFGLCMEFVQGMVPSRQFDYLDMAANTGGVVFAWAITYTWCGNLAVNAERLYDRLSALNLFPMQST